MRLKKINTDYIKSYKTEKNLERALEKLNLPDTVTAYKVELNGRYTAIFTNISTEENYHLLAYIANKGFQIVG